MTVSRSFNTRVEAKKARSLHLITDESMQVYCNKATVIYPLDYQHSQSEIENV